MAPAKLKEDRRWSAEKAKANVTTLTVEEAEAKLVRADKERGWVVKIFTEEIRARMHSSCQTKRVLYSSIDVGDAVYVLATDDALICLRSGFKFRLLFNALRKPSSTAKGGKFEKKTGKLTLWRPLVLQIAKMEEEFLADNSDADSDSDTDSDSDAVEEEKKKKVRERGKKTKVAQKKKAGVEAKQKEKAKKAKKAEVEAAAIAKQKEQDKKVQKEKRDQERLRRKEEKAELDRIKVLIVIDSIVINPMRACMHDRLPEFANAMLV